MLCAVGSVCRTGVRNLIVIGFQLLWRQGFNAVGILVLSKTSATQKGEGRGTGLEVDPVTQLYQQRIQVRGWRCFLYTSRGQVSLLHGPFRGGAVHSGLCSGYSFSLALNSCLNPAVKSDKQYN